MINWEEVKRSGHSLYKVLQNLLGVAEGNHDNSQLRFWASIQRFERETQI